MEENCLFLKEIDDAMAIRNKMLDCLELASLPTTSEEEKKRLLHFVVVGGGPTGVEAAAELRGTLHSSAPQITVDQEADVPRLFVFAQTLCRATCTSGSPSWSLTCRSPWLS